jgi:predicted O-methyltransferase YrrM
MPNAALPNAALTAVATRMLKRRYPGEELPDFDLSVADVPRYAMARAKASLARRRATEPQPWITHDAIATLATLLKPTDDGLEFGSGGSTIWLARHCKSLRSVEAFDPWYEPLQKRLVEEGVTNATVELVSAPQLGYLSDAHRTAYVNVFPDIAPESLGLVFVDGEYRDATALRGITLLKPGGVLVLDNANTYLPSRSPVPWKVREPASPQWKEFVELTSGWRQIWTTNGVWDTVIWIKPA